MTKNNARLEYDMSNPYKKEQYLDTLWIDPAKKKVYRHPRPGALEAQRALVFSPSDIQGVNVFAISTGATSGKDFYIVGGKQAGTEFEVFRLKKKYKK